ncbi:MAG: hypothetical protein KatS3mg031_0134 [Chitinophagales bacterium]|nr:MAG: hypothetical protein KatS3mg031_0134 [Chitinophagales bacterium]
MQQIQNLLSERLRAADELRMIYKPLFYRLSDARDAERFEELLDTPGLRVSDELNGQLRELIKLKNPTIRFSPDELNRAAREYLQGRPSSAYGVWVYYPWLNHVVHILDKEEYRLLRTNRNQYKITPEERAILETKKIGVLGLSVGQSVALTLSMERGYGELRIADFDVLELTNLNRIRSGVQDLGLLKTVSTARQIAEIDPFLNVKCFHQGLTEDNLEEFLLEGGKLDLLIDECDGLDIKILARLKARELKIPVLMETSDRGMLDVERFDLEPNRPILHGLIDHLDLNPANLKGLTNEEKIPYVLPMVGLETMSDRLKASMLEVEQSITTWPQLASDVILGGALSASVCRRIFLDQFRASGRFFVDINEIVSEDSKYRFNQVAEETQLETPVIAEEVDVKSLAARDGQIALTPAQAAGLVEAAIRAPSGGNNQPWKWVYEGRNLYLLLDRNRATAFLDFEQAGSYLSLGAATENLVLQAHRFGLEVSVETFPDAQNPLLAAVFRFFHGAPPAGITVESHQHDGLADAIGIRLTNRLIRERKNIEAIRLFELQHIGQTVTGAEVKLITGAEAMKQVGELISRTDRIMLTHREGHKGFVSEIRWTEEEAQRTRDGVDLATVDLTPGEIAGLKIARNWSVVKTLNNWGGGSVFEKLSRKGVAAASALGLITMPGTDSLHYFLAGRALERLWLYANLHQIALQPMTALPFMLLRLVRGNGQGLSEGNIKDLHRIRLRLHQLFDVGENRNPAFLFRLLVAEDPKVKSLRRPLEEVLVYKDPA